MTLTTLGKLEATVLTLLKSQLLLARHACLDEA